MTKLLAIAALFAALSSPVVAAPAAAPTPFSDELPWFEVITQQDDDAGSGNRDSGF